MRMDYSYGNFESGDIIVRHKKTLGMMTYRVGNKKKRKILQTGFITGDICSQNQEELDRYSVDRDYDLYYRYFQGRKSLVLKYANGTNVIRINDAFLQKVVDFGRPMILKHENNPFGKYDSVIFTKYLYSSFNVPVMAYVRDCALIVLLEKITGNVALIHAGWKPLFSGIITRTIDNILSDLPRGISPHFTAQIMPHIQVLELGPELEINILRYIENYQKYIPDIEEVLTRSATTDRIYLDITRCITRELCKYLNISDIHVTSGDTRMVNASGELLYGSLRGSRRSNQDIEQKNYNTKAEKDILERNIKKLNAAFVMEI